MEVLAVAGWACFYRFFCFGIFGGVEEVEVVYFEYAWVTVSHGAADEIRGFVFETFGCFSGEDERVMADGAGVRGEFLQDNHIGVFLLDGDS